MTQPASPPPTAQNVWPSQWLISLHQKAIDEGCCRVAGIGQARAKSLIAAFHRIRRRSDSKHKLGFIPPEFNLVVALWEPEHQGVLFVYSSLPEGMLPTISSVPEAERQQIMRRETVVAPPAGLEDIDSLVERLVSESQGKAPEQEPEL